MKHSLKIRVYYEDTDAQGIVYYANYLKFFERSRTEFLREVGYKQEKLMQKGAIFVVRAVDMKLLKPAKLDDIIEVSTGLSKLGRVTFNFYQEVRIKDELICHAEIKCGCLSLDDFSAFPLPNSLHEGMKKLL
tara:strand:- start:43402 stop:43800 length:399 start_codon:yes stop_codon:yes gene_type:complete